MGNIVDTEKRISTLEIILPAYNPRHDWEESIVSGIGRLKPFLLENQIELHLTIVNDGSDPACYSLAVLEKLDKLLDGRFRLLSYDKNRGKGFCLRHGVRESSTDFQIYTDVDFPFGPEPVIAAWRKLADGADVVMGVRGADYGKALPWRRSIISSAVRFCNRILLRLPDRICDTQAGFKGFSARGRQCFLATKTDSFLFDTEFIYYSHRAKLTVETVLLTLRPGVVFSQFSLKTIYRESMNLLSIIAAGGKSGHER